MKPVDMEHEYKRLRLDILKSKLEQALGHGKIHYTRFYNRIPSYIEWVVDGEVDYTWCDWWMTKYFEEIKRRVYDEAFIGKTSVTVKVPHYPISSTKWKSYENCLNDRLHTEFGVYVDVNVMNTQVICYLDWS
jgi:hypothetical protein